MPSAYTILFFILALVALATFLVPAGSYRFQEGVPVAGSYHTLSQSPQGLGALLRASFTGFREAADICVFLLMVGGFLGVVMKSGAVDAALRRLIRRLNGREQILIPVLMCFLGLGGSSFGMWEETMAFFPLLIPVFLAAGYDALVGISVILLGAGAGVIASTVNPFATGIASGFAGVSLGEGLGLRLLQWVLFEGAAIVAVMRYAAKVKRPPPEREGEASEQEAFSGRQKAILWVFAGTFLLMVYGVTPLQEMGLPLPTLGWWFPELSALFLVGAVAAGLLDRQGETTLIETFLAGAGELLGVAFLIGISRGVTVLMDAGHITDTLLYWGEKALSGLGPVGFILLVFLLYLPLTVLIPSTSGLAALTIPLAAPLAGFAGVSGALVVTAFQTASGIVNLVTPTSAVVMGALTLGKVPYDRWLRFSGTLLAFDLLTSLALLTVSAAMGG